MAGEPPGRVPLVVAILHGLDRGAALRPAEHFVDQFRPRRDKSPGGVRRETELVDKLHPLDRRRCGILGPDERQPRSRAGWWQASDGNWHPPQPAAPYGWGAPGMSPADERTWAMLSHLSHFFGSWVAQLIILATKGKESAFVRDQVVESLNFTITVTIAAVVSLVLCLVLIGFLLLFGVVVAAVVFPIIGAVSANRGERYRYPVCIRLVH